MSAAQQQAGLAGGAIDVLATALVSQAYAPQAHSTPPPDDGLGDGGNSNDPLDPRKPSRPTDPAPVDSPPVPGLKPLE
ncbi:hypothetical protein DFR29_105145 [Tahibacter aquaticus]|uniref:Uncharacterized protein n=1 Tax=Tahibacter aquaticus TaxID=520092 RepID=A0A4R6Z0D9_9GAMM|nr:hypothetical protein [Tahibacter aquaticus]TDR44962.1 hypothetical protein DFR29_105145 [Tahibacter aquaticus]